MSQPQQRRQRRPRTAPSVGTIVTTAALAYGTYRLVDWVWNQQQPTTPSPADNGTESDEEEEDDDRPSSSQPFSVASSVSDWLFGGVGSYNSDTGTSFNTNVRSTANSLGFSSAGQRKSQKQKWKERRQRMARCRDETQKAMESFLPTIRRKIEDATNTNKETKELKRLRAVAASTARATTQTTTISPTVDRNNNKNNIWDGEQAARKTMERELWEHIKVQSVTRMITTAMAHTILFLVLTTQVHLLGGKLWAEHDQSTSSSSSSSSFMESYQTSHRRVLLQTYDYFLDRGIASLIQTVERAVSHVLAEWDASDPSSLHMTKEIIHTKLEEILRVVLYGRMANSTTTSSSRRQYHRRPVSLLRFLLPPEDCEEQLSEQDETELEQPIEGIGQEEDPLACSIRDETWDLLESPVWNDALLESLDVTLTLMRDRNWGTIFVVPSVSVTNQRVSPNVTIDSNNNDPQPPQQPPTPTKPLAQILAQFKHTSNSFYRWTTTTTRTVNTTTENSTASPSGSVSKNLNPKWIDYSQSLRQIPSVMELGDVSFESMF